MTELDHQMDRLTVAAGVLVSAYADLLVRGYDKEPNLIAASLDDIELVVRQLRDAGFGADGSAHAGRAELIEETVHFAAHACTCEWCLHRSDAPDGERGEKR